MPSFRFSDISLATRLSLVALLVTLVSLVITATAGLLRGSGLADELVDDRLVSVASARATSLELYLQTVEREVAALAASPATSEAIDELADAFRELDDTPTPPAASEAVTNYYLTEVVPDLEAVRGGRVGAAAILPDGSAALQLQSAYTVPREGPDGEIIAPPLVVDPGDGSAYSALHPIVHRTFGRIGVDSGFDDLFLISATSDVIVYSARKRIDFATSLELGPQSGTALARLVAGIARDPEPGESRLSDIAAYPPAADQPTAFVAAPALDDGELVGYLAVAIPYESIDSVLSGNGTWSGFGDTGESYLVGDDGTMRSTARPYREGAADYLARGDEPGPAALDDDQRRRIRATGTTALVQEVDRDVLAAAREGPGIEAAVNYRGDAVRTAFRPVSLAGVDWFLFAEVSADELDDPIESYARNMLFAIALFVVIVTFVAVRWADRIVAPVRAIAGRLRRARASAASGADDGAELRTDGPVEYGELSANVEQMLARLGERQQQVAARADERAALLRQFLPASVVRRSEAGDVLDHVANASVVVLTVDGIGGVLASGAEREVRDALAELVDDIVAIAAELGVERIKLTGATYYAACGATRPYLDHVRRAVDFTEAVKDAVRDVAGGRLSVRGGIAVGPVSVGLTDRTGLVYDVWGPTVSRAEGLAMSTAAGTVAADAAVRELFADVVVAGESADGSVVITGVVQRDGAAT